MALDWQTEYHRYRRYFFNIGRFYQKKKVRVYTEIVLSLFTITFFIVFAIRPTLVTIAGLVKTIKDQRLVNQKLEEKVQILGPAQQKYLLIEPELKFVDQALPKTPQLSLLVKQLEALSQASNVNLKTVQFKQVVLKNQNTSSKHEAIGFSLMAQGNYQDLKKFLEKLYLLRRIVALKGFSFKKPEAKQEQNINPEWLTLSVEAQAYSLASD